MYSGAAVNSEAGLAPAGWAVPSADDVALLRDYVGTLPGLKLRSESGWTKNPGTGITASMPSPGSTTRPFRRSSPFGTATPDVLFWTATVLRDPLTRSDGLVYYRFYDGNNRLMFDPNASSFAPTMHDFRFGHYVRCVRK